MQITFDPRDRNACASVLAVIAALHGSAAFDEARNMGYDSLAFGAPIEDESQDNRLLPEALDAAQAFGAAAPFAHAPEAISPTSAPVSTPESGVPSSPTIPAATPSVSPSSSVTVDKHGLPWDGRIHSGPADKKPMNGDGTWRRKRGVDDATVAAVEAELRQVMGAPVPVVSTPVAAPEVPVAPAVPTPPPAVALPEAAPVATVPTPPPPTAAVAPPPAPSVPTPPPAPAVTASGPAVAAPATDFAGLMRKITAAQTAGTLTVEATHEISTSLGLTGVRDLIKRPDLVAAFDSLLPAGV